MENMKPTGYVVLFLADPHLPLNVDDPHNWRPFKDLARMILQEEPNSMDIDPGSFKVASPQTIGWNIKSKNAALKVMQRLAGNYWFGSHLMLPSLWESYDKRQTVTPVPVSIVAPSPPEDLGLVYRISETNIRRIEHSPFHANVCLNNSQSSYGYPVSQPMAMYPQAGVTYLSSTHSTTQQLQEAAQIFHQGQKLYGPAWSKSIGTPSPPIVCADPRQRPVPYQQGQNISVTTMPSMHSTQAHQSLAIVGPTYYANPNGALVNVAHGAHSVHPRGVFVRDLPHHATKKQIEDFFRSAGSITHCVLNAKKKKISTAEIFFTTEDEARFAVKQFDGSKFLGRAIEVKLNRTDEASESGTSGLNGEYSRRRGAGQSSSSSSRPGPIIVNGSGEGPHAEEGYEEDLVDEVGKFKAR